MGVVIRSHCQEINYFCLFIIFYFLIWQEKKDEKVKFIYIKMYIINSPRTFLQPFNFSCIFSIVHKYFKLNLLHSSW